QRTAGDGLSRAAGALRDAGHRRLRRPGAVAVIAPREIVVEATTEGFAVDRATTLAELLARPSTIFDGPFVWPLLVLDRAVLDHNVGLHASFCRARGLELAPHGKTTMAPAIFDAQFAAGAWGMT